VGFLGGGDAFIALFNTNNAQQVSDAMFSLGKPYTLVGFEPGPADPQSDAMTTAPRRQCKTNNC
jgi:hypothetical protein